MIWASFCCILHEFGVVLLRSAMIWGSFCCVLHEFGVVLLRSALTRGRFAALCVNLGSFCCVLQGFGCRFAAFCIDSSPVNSHEFCTDSPSSSPGRGPHLPPLALSASGPPGNAASLKPAEEGGWAPSSPHVGRRRRRRRAPRCRRIPPTGRRAGPSHSTRARLGPRPLKGTTTAARKLRPRFGGGGAGPGRRAALRGDGRSQKPRRSTGRQPRSRGPPDACHCGRVRGRSSLSFGARVRGRRRPRARPRGSVPSERRHDRGVAAQDKASPCGEAP